MRTFAQEPKTSQQKKSAKSAKSGRVFSIQIHKVSSILHLQRTIGNQAVQRLLHDNNHIEDQVKTALETPRHRFTLSQDGAIQQTVPATTSNGELLSPDARAAMETRFGYDFSRVRVHTNNQTAAALGAKALTSGDHIFFRPGRRPSDRPLLTHEIAHVVQQATGEASALQGVAGNESVRKALEKRAEHHSRRIDQGTYKPIRPLPPLSLASGVLQFDFEEDVLRELHRLPSPAQEGLAEAEQRRRIDVVTRRRTRLRALFRSLSAEEAQQYHERLRVRRREDTLSERFHDILATATLRELLRILESIISAQQWEEETTEREEETEEEESSLTPVPSPETPELQDCRETMQQTLPRAHQIALEQAAENSIYYTNLAIVIRHCTSLQEVYARIGDAAAQDLTLRWGINVIPALREHYQLPLNLNTSEIRTQIADPIEHIADVYGLVEQGLDSADFNYECEYEDSWWYQRCDGTRTAWVLENIRSDIHLCVDDLDPNDIEELAATIVHEASHLFGNTTDELEPEIENAHNYCNLGFTPSPEERPWLTEMEDGIGAD